jgi:hypothetical protein
MNEVKRISLLLSVEQINFIESNIVNLLSPTLVGQEAAEAKNTAGIVMAILNLFNMPKRSVRPKSDRGQGRKKKNNIMHTESKQDVFPFHENSLAPCVGVNSDA